MSRSPASTSTTTTRALTAAVLTAALVVLAGCGLLDRDDRPASDYTTFAQEVAALPAVDSVTPDPDAPADRSGWSFLAALDEGADAASLRTTDSRVTTLLDAYKYPDGTPHITLTSGAYSASLPDVRGYPPGVTPPGSTVDLSDLPQLLPLPHVAHGVMAHDRVAITLEPGTDLRAWVEDVVTRDGTSSITAETADTAAATATTDATAEAAGPQPPLSSPSATPSETPSESPSKSPSSPQSTETFTFPLGSDTAPEAVTGFFSLADSVGATVVSGHVGGMSQPTADFLIPSSDTLRPLYDALIDEYGDVSPEPFSIDTADGLSVSFGSIAGTRVLSNGSHVQADDAAIDHTLQAQRLLGEVGAALVGVEIDRGSVQVEAAEGDVLRDVARVLGSPGWPFAPADRVTIRHPDTPADNPHFDAGEWGERAELLASVWDAGFTSVRYSERGELSISVSSREGPDYTTAAGRDALIGALRGGGWTGTASISLQHGPHPHFRSTATGEAEDPRNSLAGEDDALSGWGLEFVEAWDATAS